MTGLRTATIVALTAATALWLAVSTAVAATPPPVPTTAVAHVGVLTVVPATGTDLVPFSLVTSKACPAGTNVIGTILGPGLPKDGINVVPNTTAAIFPHTAADGLFMPSNNTLRTLVDQLPDPPQLKGTYALRVECRGPAKIADLGEFTGSMVWDGHHGYVATEPAVPAASLVTVAPVTDPPVPSAAAARAGATTTAPVVVLARPAAAETSSSTHRLGPWLVGAGALVLVAGVVLLLRNRRVKSAQVRS